MSHSTLRYYRGFTLIELITVVIIIAIMAALALPQYTRFIERSQASTAKNALDMIRKAEATYFTLNSQCIHASPTAELNLAGFSFLIKITFFR